MKNKPIRHEFVDSIPRQLEPDTIYVSTKFSTTVHLCFCGCGNEVVAPLSPKRWQLHFDGETVTLTPSIGSWQLPCRSHYYIWKDTVEWAKRYTEDEIAEAIAENEKRLDQLFARHRAKEKHGRRGSQ